MRRCGDLDPLTERAYASKRCASENHTNYHLTSEKRDLVMASSKVTLRSKKARAAAAAC